MQTFCLHLSLASLAAHACFQVLEAGGIQLSIQRGA
jgi:hypothetical protein